MQKKETKNLVERPPVVVVMGHIDHGKSTLLSFIRKNKEPLNEAGGITQHISAYEVEHLAKDGEKHTITFLDTPGHEAFLGIRRRGASVADIAILVVSAEDGVKPQTVEALKSILDSKIPYIVAINKIDKPGADIEMVKQSLAEKGVYLEGYGGDIPYVSVSSKTGEGVDDLLELILLVAQMNEFKGDKNASGEGIILESNRDTKKGISATCVIKNGHIEKGMYVVSGVTLSPVRILENYNGKDIDSATFSSPVKIIGWDDLPTVGSQILAFRDRDEARKFAQLNKDKVVKSGKVLSEVMDESIIYIPIIVKADTGSSLEAVLGELEKLSTDRVKIKIVSSSIGTISENDVLAADNKEKAIIVGFHSKIDALARSLSERNQIEIKNFDIIYKMSEWVKDELIKRTPKIKVTESLGIAKVLKVFSKTKDKQIFGGRVEKGSIALGAQVKILRRETEIADGRVRELQSQKISVSEVGEGKEFGALVESKVEIAPGDKIESFIIVEK